MSELSLPHMLLLHILKTCPEQIPFRFSSFILSPTHYCYHSHMDAFYSLTICHAPDRVLTIIPLFSFFLFRSGVVVLVDVVVEVVTF